MDMLKNAQTSQSSLDKKFTNCFLCLSLLSFTILNNLSGLFPPFIPFVLVAMILVIWPYLSRRQELNLRRVYLLTIGLLTTVLFNVATHPAEAQFMNKAQTFFTNSFTNSANGTTSIGTLITLTFNVLRGIYIVYLAVAFIGIFNSMRNDEDWMTAARTPMLVLMTVTLGDLLTGLIANV